MAIDLLVTIGTLRDQHLALMREWQGLTDEDKRTRAADMRRIAVEAGKNIESPMERDEAQGIVDYWASAIASLPGGSYPELLTIDDYTSTQAVDAGRSVCEAYEALQPQEAQRLADAVKQILAYAITRGGTTLRDFINPDGAPGYFEQELLVYGREGEPCRQCGRLLRHATIGQRASVWCGHCQR